MPGCAQPLSFAQLALTFFEFRLCLTQAGGTAIDINAGKFRIELEELISCAHTAAFIHPDFFDQTVYLG